MRNNNQVSIKKNISEIDIKKIFGNLNNCIKFLELKNIEFKKNRIEIYKKIIENWNYEIDIKIIRSLFQSSNKYKNSLSSKKWVNFLTEEWVKIFDKEEIKWPFSQGQFDNFVQHINNNYGLFEGKIKDKKVKIAAVKFRRIKELNTLRNDYIEFLIFNSSIDILPTLSHSKGTDFYINGVPYDQKVSSSVTEQFKKKYGSEWKKIAINNPKIVAEYLYMFQDEGRFDANPRLLIVNLNNSFNFNNLEKEIKNNDFSSPLKITFSYKHKTIEKIKIYNTECFLIFT